ncbi:MAG: SGNH/GDSL hydrolase family protein [Pirellulales bacterium]
MPARCLRPACFAAGLVATFGVFGPAAAWGQAPPGAGVPPRFTLVDGDRVVLLGSTFIERDQSYGYLEAALSSRFHRSDIQFRNLGWSGDNVFGEARAGFQRVEHGFEELKKHVAALSPTVILLNYGANESFAGKAGLERFLAGLETLLAALDETGARIVFIAPPPHEDLGRPLPDPAEHNRSLQIYAAAIANVAARRGAPCVNLFELLGGKLQPPAETHLTDNGIHLTANGYWRAAPVIEQALGLPERRWQVEIDAARGNVAASGTLVRQARFSPGEIRFFALDRQLPLPPPPADSPPECREVNPRVVRAFDLPAGTYALKIDGRQVAAGTARQWADGVTVADGPELAQAERLRETILEKNELYFHRWRPQNVTYLLGFRKHEQGQNAAEIPQFDPLVAARETAIRGLCTPIEHEYQLVRVEE